MPNPPRRILIATRGSALAMAQANLVLSQCRGAFPEMEFQIKIVKTTGDKLQTASMAQEGHSLPKGLFTKELEVALLNREADLAVHSLKDLPTELPDGLELGAVGKRADVRDVLIYRDARAGLPEPNQITSPPPGIPVATRRAFHPHFAVKDLPTGTVVATSSTRRKAQLLVANPGLKVPDIRGNVATRMHKVAKPGEMDGTVLALAGLGRLQFSIAANGCLEGEGVPPGLLASILDLDVMLPCVGQGAVGIEIRVGDEVVSSICERLNDPETMACVTAERAFLAAMGGGCQSPVAAYAEVAGNQLQMRAISFASGPERRSRGSRTWLEPIQLGQQLAAELKD